MTDHKEPLKLKHIVHLEVVFPTKDGSQDPSYSAKGKIKNQVELIKLEYGSPQFYSYLKTFTNSGYLGAIVKQVLTKEGYMYTNEIAGKKYTGLRWKEAEPASREITDKIKTEIETQLLPARAIKTPDQSTVEALQKQNEAMAARLEALEANVKPKEEETLIEDDVESDLQKVRDRYKEVVQSKPFHGWNVEQLNAKINAKIAEHQE